MSPKGPGTGGRTVARAGRGTRRANRPPAPLSPVALGEGILGSVGGSPSPWMRLTAAPSSVLLQKPPRSKVPPHPAYPPRRGPHARSPRRAARLGSRRGVRRPNAGAGWAGVSGGSGREVGGTPALPELTGWREPTPCGAVASGPRDRAARRRPDTRSWTSRCPGFLGNTLCQPKRSLC